MIAVLEVLTAVAETVNTFDAALLTNDDAVDLVLVLLLVVTDNGCGLSYLFLSLYALWLMVVVVRSFGAFF